MKNGSLCPRMALFSGALINLFDQALQPSLLCIVAWHINPKIYRPLRETTVRELIVDRIQKPTGKAGNENVDDNFEVINKAFLSTLSKLHSICIMSLLQHSPWNIHLLSSTFILKSTPSQVHTLPDITQCFNTVIMKGNNDTVSCPCAIKIHSSDCWGGLSKSQDSYIFVLGWHHAES